MNNHLIQQQSMGTESSTVDSLNHPWAIQIRRILSDTSNQLEKIIIDDEENIIQALYGQVAITQVFTIDLSLISEKLKQLLPSTVEIIEVSKRTCKKIFDSSRASHLFAVADLPQQKNISFLESSKKDIIVLDSLSITGNIGAIIRTANAFSVGALLFLNTQYSQLFDRRIIRASRGYLFRIPLIVATPEEFLAFCSAQHIKLVVTSSHASDSIDVIAKCAERLALIFGSEKEGYRDDMISRSARHVKIPMNSSVESLNVSVAASICMYLRSQHQ